MAMKRAKNISDDPKSRSAVMTSSENPQASTSGPITRMPPLNSLSSSCRSLRYDARKTASTILATSPGWKLIGPKRTQIRLPLMFSPIRGSSGIRGETADAEVAQPQQHDDDAEERADVGRQRRRLAEAGQRVGADDENDDEHEQAELGAAAVGPWAHPSRCGDRGCHGLLVGVVPVGSTVVLAVLVVLAPLAAPACRRALASTSSWLV